MSNGSKLLANLIKEDLQKDLAEAKKGENNKRSWLIGLGENCSEYRGNERRLTYFGSLETDSGKKYKERRVINGRGWIDVFPEELKPDDWKEIESLVQQIDNFDEEKRKQEKEKQQKKQAKIDQIMGSNPKHFFYEGLREWSNSADIRHAFLGVENGQRFWLVLPREHPITASLPNPDKYPNREQDEIFFLVEGVENISLQSAENRFYPWKEVNLSNKITFTKKNISNWEKPKIELSAESKKALKIVGGVVGTLIIMVIIGLWLKRKNKIKIFRNR